MTRIARPMLAVALALAAALAPTARAELPGCPAPLPGGEDWPGQKQWLALEQAGYVLGAIEIKVGDIYERDDAWYAHGANLLHVDTRTHVVEEHLVLHEGDPVVARKVHDSLRELRALGIFREARFEPVACAEGKVRARVEVDDAWTLLFSVKANSVGGQTATGLKLEDRNFLGSGKEVYVERTQDATRSAISYAYQDPALFGSDWRMFVLHSDQSDGASNQVALRLPFRTLDQRWAFEFEVADIRQDISFYQAGGEAWRADSVNELRTATAWRLLAHDGDSGWRIGFGARSENRSYGTLVAVDPALRPAPLLNPYAADSVTLAFGRFHDHWASFHNIALFDRIEDYNLGLDAVATVAFAPEALGNGGEETFRYELTARWAARWPEDGLLALAVDAGVREDDGDWNDGLVSATGTWYHQWSPRNTRLVRLGLEWRSDPDPEHEISLGGLDGLLGYPAHWVVGDRAWKLHYEERGFTDKVLFQTLKLGWSVILEAGSAREIGTATWHRTLANLGGGLRVGNLRGAYGQVLYFTVFTPLVQEPGLDRVQFVVGDVISF